MKSKKSTSSRVGRSRLQNVYANVTLDTDCSLSVAAAGVNKHSHHIRKENKPSGKENHQLTPPMQIFQEEKENKKTHQSIIAGSSHSWVESHAGYSAEPTYPGSGPHPYAV